MVAKTRVHTTPGEGVKIKAGSGKARKRQGGGRAKASAARIAALKKEEKRKHAVDVRSGRVSGSKPTFSSRLRTAAARTPLAAGYFARSGGGGGSRK